MRMCTRRYEVTLLFQNDRKLGVLATKSMTHDHLVFSDVGSARGSQFSLSGECPVVRSEYAVDIPGVCREEYSEISRFPTSLVIHPRIYL